MFRTLANVKFLTVMVFFLVLMVTVLLPVIEQIAATVVPLQPSGENANLAITGVIDTTLTAVFVGMPLVLLGGVILISFVIAGGLRGTSR
jgi:hypothetical protein